jgi:glycosyltransferase involved in cell wall biosynthesis
MAAQPLRQLWRRMDAPPIEWWTGTVDVVHGPNFVVPPARRAAQICTVHDLTCVRYPELCTSDTLQYPGLIARAIQRGAHIHTVSEFVANEVRDHFAVDPARVHVVPNGIAAVAHGDPARGRALARGAPYILAMGTVEPRKDLPTLVRAFDAVAGAQSDLRLLIAGQDGWGADALTDSIGRARHRDRIDRLGWVDDRARSDLLAGAELFAYPSLYEGFGLPPLEAMAAGTPVVTTRAGALPEVVGDAALLVPPGDVDGVAGALIRLLDDESERVRLVEKGRRRVSLYSWDRTAEALVGVYRALC